MESLCRRRRIDLETLCRPSDLPRVAGSARRSMQINQPAAGLCV